MKSLFLVITILGFFFIYPVQDKNEKVTWKENQPLMWKDFKAKAPKNNKYEANTNSGVSFSWSFISKNGKTQLKYEVHSNFYPYSSWVKEENAYLLAHEQLHFDISELHARKLRNALKEYIIGAGNDKKIKKELNQLYNTLEKERVIMQKAFDSETNHSLDHEEERKWQAFVKEELKRFI